MDVELSHHYGWQRHTTQADSLDGAAMQAVRETHAFLTADNHSMDAAERQIAWGGKTINFTSVCVYRSDGAPWLAVEYRPATPAKGESNG